jgi:hypothetical protein
MAIRIVQRPAGPTSQVQPPARIEVAQILRSTKLSEPVTIEYRLPAESGLRFEGHGQSVDRQETIARADTPLRHRLEIERVSGTGATRVTIDERIRNESGEVAGMASFDLFIL